jgi:hypothetical protein
VPVGWSFRNLYVNGRRADRAGGAIDDSWLQPNARGYLVKPGSMLDWRHPKQFEFVYDALWTQMRVDVAGIDGNELVLRQPAWAIARRAFAVKLPTSVENALELLDDYGEWYLDTSRHRIYYISRAGDQSATAVIDVPRLEQLVVGAGTLDNPVHDLNFVGLTFADTSWLGPTQAGGWPAIQAGFAAIGSTPNPLVTDTSWRKIPAAVSFTAAQRVRFVDDTFTRLGGSGLALADGSQDNGVLSSTFRDISGNGIELGDVTDFAPVDPREVVTDNAVVGNSISQVGAEYAGSVGIWGGYVRGTLIDQNRVTDVPYTGISVGWGWGRRNGPRNPAGHNTITNNLVASYLQELRDGGGVYLLGQQPGTVVAGNVVHDQGNTGYGIYLDDGSNGETVTGNAIWNAGGQPIALKGSHLTVERNYWEQPDGGYGVGFAKQSTVADNNVIAGASEAPSGIVAQAGPHTLAGRFPWCAAAEAPLPKQQVAADALLAASEKCVPHD